MRSIIDEKFADARTRATSMVRAPMGQAGGNPLGFSSNGGNLGVRQPTMQHHAEQLRHYTGWVHASVNPVAKRVARQPVRIAVVKDTPVGAGDRPGAPPAPSIPGGRKGYEPRRPWQQTAVDADTLAKHLWFRRNLPGSLKAYYETAELIDHHPILDAIENPNDIMVRWVMMFVTVACLMLTGKAYWWVKAKEREGDGESERGEPGIEIWPVPPSWMKPVHTEKKLYDHWEITPTGATEPFQVPPDQVIYFYLPDPGDPLGAIGVLQAQSRAVVADEAIAEAQRKGFANGLFPDVAIVVGRQPDVNGVPGERPALTKDQREQILMAFKQAYRGVGKAGEPIILDRIIEDIKRVSNTVRDMDFMTSGGYTKERITQGFGVNPIVMGQVEGANRSSSATADDHLCQSTVNPIIELISEVLTKWMSKLFARKGERIIVFLEEAYAIDPDSERADWALLMQAGAAQRNELRAALKGLPPIRDGEQCLVAAGVAPVDCTRIKQGAEVGGAAPVRSSLATDVFDPIMATREMTLEVPDVRQAYPFDCGAAAARAVALYRGLSAPGGTDEDDFIWELGTTPETGTSPAHIRGFFRHRGCQVVPQDHMAAAKLRRYVAQGWPVLCATQYLGDGEAPVANGTASSHWVVVCGFTPTHLIVQCPVEGRVSVPEQAFVTNWHDHAMDGTPYTRYGIAVGPAPVPSAVDASTSGRASGPWRSKVRDGDGHDHANDGRFTGPGGGGSGGANKPSSGGNKPPAKPDKPADGNKPQDKPSGDKPGDKDKPAKPDTGKVSDPPEHLAEKAKGVFGRIKEAGVKAVAAAGAVGEKAKHLAYSATWAVASAKVKADDVLDTTHDYSKIINDKGMCAHLGLPMSGGAMAAIGANVLAFGITKCKEMLARRRDGKWTITGGGRKAWLRTADDSALAELADAVHECMSELLPAAWGEGNAEVLSPEDILIRLKQDRAEALDTDPADDDAGGDPPADGGKAVTCAASLMDRAHRVEIRTTLLDAAERELADAVHAFLEDEQARMRAAVTKLSGDAAKARIAPAAKSDTGDLPDDGRDEEGLADFLDRVCPVPSMTRRLRAAVIGPLTSAAEEAAQQEHDELSPAQKSELRAKGFVAGYWTRLTQNGAKGRKPKVDRKPLPKVIRDRVNGYLDDMVNDPYWSDINKTTRGKLAKAVRRGVANGEDAAQIEDRLLVVLSDVTTAGRAVLIARTEATAAVNIGAQAAREQLPASVVSGKEWIALDDDATRDTHRLADGQVRKVGSKFKVGKCWCQYPGDPTLPPEERCQCRCYAMSVPAR